MGVFSQNHKPRCRIGHEILVHAALLAVSIFSNSCESKIQVSISQNPQCTEPEFAEKNPNKCRAAIAASRKSPLLGYESVTPAMGFVGLPFSMTPTKLDHKGSDVTDCKTDPGLPGGLVISTSLCVISGVPEEISSATYKVLMVTADGQSAPTDIEIIIKASAPAIQYSAMTTGSVSGSVGTAITALSPSLLKANGAATSCSIAPTLPSGLNISPDSCIISGTPTAPINQTTFTVTASNSAGSSTADVVITIGPAAPEINYSGGIVGNVDAALTPFSPTLLKDNGAQITCTVSPALPDGLAISPGLCVISGTPTSTLAQTTYTITASNIAGNSSTTVTITINASAPQISYTGGISASVGNAITPFSPTLLEDNGAPINCTIAPNLPDGLSISPGLCVISGTPTVTKSQTTYQVTAQNSAGESSTSFDIIVTASAPSISYDGNSPAIGSVGVALTITPSILNDNGSSIHTCSISPALPSGLLIHPTLCVISGIPEGVYSGTFQVVAMNAAGSSSPANFELEISPSPPALSYSGLQSVQTYVGSAVTITPTSLTDNGANVIGCSAAPALPTGLSIDQSSCVITGIPSIESSLEHSITANNSAGNSAPAVITILVGPQPPPGTCFIAGVAHPSLDPSCTGTSTNDGKFYVGGAIANGFFDEKTALLLHMDGDEGSNLFTDSSPKMNSVKNSGGVYISTSDPKIGTGAASFNGSNYLTAQNTNGVLDLSDQPFTIETWFYWTGYNGQAMSSIFSSSVDFGYGLAIINYGGNDRLEFWAGNNSWWEYAGDGAFVGSSNITANSWNHVAVTRHDNIFSIYLNGQLEGQHTVTSGPIGSSNLRFGVWGNNNYYFNGYLDEIRVSKGISRYSSTFTPSTSSFVVRTGCYASGFNTGGINEAGTGWCITDERYYVLGEQTTLPDSGTGVYNGKRYVAGSLLSGIVDGNCYLSGINTNTYSSGNGSCSGSYYIGGTEHPGLDLNGSGLSNADNKYYINGALAQGSIDDKTVLLMHMDGMEGSTGSFLDSSNNKLTPEVRGSPMITSSKSKFGGLSARFTGAGDYDTSERLQFGPSQQLALGAEDFTIEGWFYQIGTSQWAPMPIEIGGPHSNSDALGMWFHANTGASAGRSSWHSALWNGVGLPTSTEKWTHVAWVRSSGQMTIFVDGVAGESVPLPHSLSGNGLRIGGGAYEWYYNYDGFIDELRITKGLARYNADFAPPSYAFSTIPTGYYIAGILQPGLNGSGTGLNSLDNKYYVNGAPASGMVEDRTSLLLHMDGGDSNPSFLDSSINQLSINSPTPWSAAQYSAQVKFGQTSGWFSGGGYIYSEYSSALSLNTNDFTIETWAYPTQLNSGSDLAALIDTRPGGGGTGVVLWLDSSTGKWAGYFSTNGNTTQVVIESQAAAILNEWTHLVVVRSGQSFMLFVNGQLASSAFIDPSWDLTQGSQSRVLIGTAADSPGYSRNFIGYLDEVRITNGEARYTSNFAAPVGPFPDSLTGYYVDGIIKPGLDVTGSGCSDNICYTNGALANGYVDDKTTLLLHFDGENNSQSFIDSTNSYRSPTISGSPQIRTETSKFGGASAYFDGLNSSLFFSSTSDFAFGFGDFTLELWYKKTGGNWNWWEQTNWWEQSLLTTADPQDFDGVMLGIVGDNPQFRLGNGNDWAFRLDPVAVSANEWHHLAVARSGNTVYLFVNGMIWGTVADSTVLNNLNNGLTVGGRSPSGQYFMGYIDEVRVTKGLARYSTNFTPQSSAFSTMPYGCYANGINTGEINTSGTGWCSVSSKYYVNREETGLPQAGTGTHNGKYFVEGSPANGLINDICYLGGVAQSANILNGSGYCNGVYYISGIAHPGLDPSGTGLSSTDNKYYINATLASGYVEDKAVLLLHMDGAEGSTSFPDASSSEHVASPSGDVKISSMTSKFGGGSAYFDGSEDRLDLATSSDFNLETGDYTVEFFANIQSISGWDSARLFTIEHGSESWGIIVHNDSSFGVSVNHYGYGEQINANAVLYNKLGSWMHFALVRNGMTRTLYVDGINVGSTTSRVLPDADAQLSIGGNTLAYSYTMLNAYIDEFRITKGSARYTSNFTPPTSSFINSTGYYIQGILQPGLDSTGTGFNTLENRYYVNGSPAVGYVADNTTLLLNVDSINGSTAISDASGKNQTINSLGNAQLSSTQSKFGGSSLYLDGSSCLETSPSANFKLSRRDFTVEMWAYVTGGTPTLMRIDAGDGTGHGLLIGHSQPLTFAASSVPNSWTLTGTFSSFLFNQWHHVAVTRSGNTMRAFLDGVEIFSSSFDGAIYQTSNTPIVRIGAANSSCQYPMEGYLDDIKITQGKALYTSNFTPSTNAANTYGVCYSSGYDTGSINSYGTGWCAPESMFYVSGAAISGLDSNGTGFGSDGKQYINGSVVAEGSE